MEIPQYAYRLFFQRVSGAAGLETERVSSDISFDLHLLEEQNIANNKQSIANNKYRITFKYWIIYHITTKIQNTNVQFIPEVVLSKNKPN